MAVKGSGGDLRSIDAGGLRRPVSRQARTADRALPRRGARRRDGRLLPAVRVRREPRRRVDRHAAARVPAVRPRRSSASGLGDRAGGQRQRPGRSSTSSTPRYGRRIVWVPWQRPGLRAGADAAPRGRRAAGLRRHRPRQPRPVHVGRHAAGVLLEQHQDHRPDGRVRRGASPRASGRPLFGGPPATPRPSIASRPPPRCCRRCAAPCRRTAASSGTTTSRTTRSTFAELALGRRSVPAGHELSGSLPAHAHLPDVRAVERRQREDVAQLQQRIATRSSGTATTTRPTTTRARSPTRRRCATRTRRSSSSPGSASSASARTSARRASRPSSSSTPST